MRARIIARRAGLAECNILAVNLASSALVALGDIINGHMADLRCDRSERMRQIQVDGTTGLQSEDLCAIALESDLGREAVVEWARVLLGALDYEVLPRATGPISVESAAAVLAEDVGDLESAVLRHEHLEVIERDSRRAELDAVKVRAAARFEEQRVRAAENAGSGQEARCRSRRKTRRSPR